MTGPNLSAKDISSERGVAPPKLKSHLKELKSDDQTIVEWVIQNFVPNESNANSNGKTLDLQVCIDGDVKTVTFVVAQGPH